MSLQVLVVSEVFLRQQQAFPLLLHFVRTNVLLVPTLCLQLEITSLDAVGRVCKSLPSRTGDSGVEH